MTAVGNGDWKEKHAFACKQCLFVWILSDRGIHGCMQRHIAYTIQGMIHITSSGKRRLRRYQDHFGFPKSKKPTMRTSFCRAVECVDYDRHPAWQNYVIIKFPQFHLAQIRHSQLNWSANYIVSLIAFFYIIISGELQYRFPSFGATNGGVCTEDEESLLPLKAMLITL